MALLLLTLYIFVCSLTKNYDLLLRRYRAHCDTHETLNNKLSQIVNTHKYLEIELNKLRPQIMHLKQEKAYWMRYVLTCIFNLNNITKIASQFYCL